MWDTAGQEDYDRLRPLSYPNTDCVVLVCSVDNPYSLTNIKAKWIKEIKHYCGKGVPILLCANKSDLLGDVRKKQELHNKGVDFISEAELQKTKKEVGASVEIMTSAKTGTNVKTMFQLACGLALNKKPEIKQSPCKLF